MSEIDDLREFNHHVHQPKNVNSDLKSCMPVAQGSSEHPINFSTMPRLWAVHGDSVFVPCEKAIDTLPPDHYIINFSSTLGIYFERHPINVDNLFCLPDSTSSRVISQIQKFWTLESHFRDYGFLWKRGILMWGPAGSGKTSTVQIISERFIKNQGVVISVSDPSLASQGLTSLRRIEPKRPLLCILEDIESIASTYGEPNLLSLLDGENQIDNVVFLATTNYPEKLDPRLVNRPSRFDIVTKIRHPNASARAYFLSRKSPRLASLPAVLLQWVRDTDGFSIAHLKELIISVEVFNAAYDQALARLKTMMQIKSSSTEDNKPIGFTTKQHEDDIADSVDKALNSMSTELKNLVAEFRKHQKFTLVAAKWDEETLAEKHNILETLVLKGE